MSWEQAAGLFLFFFLSPLLPGITNRTKAMFAGRKGQPLLQLYYDLAKLLKKGAVYSETTSWLFRAGPIVALSACATAGVLMPQFGIPPLVSFAGDFLLLFYLLALSRFFTVCAALDTGSSFEGMGASREVFFGALTEITVFLAFLFLVTLTGQTSLAAIFEALPGAEQIHKTGLLLVAISLFCVFLAENSRIPVDDPNTHLELTMIHEVMVLDHGGPDFAFIQYAASLKFMLLGSLVWQVLTPFSVGMTSPALAILWAGLVLIAVAVGVVESVMARYRMVQVPQFIAASWAAAALGFVLLIVRLNG